jgi:diguanylate cyclase (GGDEF)-like protein/PAS domain S-box-containing protein
MARMLGYDSAQELVASVTDISQQVYVDPESREELARLLRELGMVKNFECAVRRKDGSQMWFSANVQAVYEDGVLVGYEGTNEDITTRKVAEDRVQYLAYYDALTGLPNRTLLRDRLTKALADARRQKYKIALLFLDLDGFKDINDSLGHAVGDLFLQEVAVRLKRYAREQDTVARLGGDEFLIMLTHVEDVSDAAVAAERFMGAMSGEVEIEGHHINVSCSVGISIFPEHSADEETLIRNADAAMYSAKTSGRHHFRFFTEDMNAQVAEKLTLENGLRRALDRKEFFLMYQPQMDIATGKVTGLEALLRWQHPELGLVPPDKFIRIAENSGLIVPIGEWVLRTACSQAKKWQDEGIPAISVAVNVSAVQFRQAGFCELVRKVVQDTGLAPQYLELELTESLLLANADVTVSVLQELKAMGVTLAIDDFGTGYSSFSYLRQFHVNNLKIDRSFINDVATNPDDAAITAAIIGMAKSLHLRVIAEGVEDEAQMSFLRAQQCDEIQGFYFSKPLATDDVADDLRRTAGNDLAIHNGAR